MGDPISDTALSSYHPGEKRHANNSSGLVAKRLKSVSFSDLFYLWIFIQLLWAGRLSVEDLKNVLRGMLSVSGMVFLSVVTILFYLLRHIISNL